MLGDRTLELRDPISEARRMWPEGSEVVWVAPPAATPTAAPQSGGALVPVTHLSTAQFQLPAFLQGNVTLPIVGTVPKVAALAGAAVILLLLSSGSRGR